MTEHSNPNKTIRELIEETRLARQAGKNFLKPDTSFTIYNEITKDQSSASGDSLIYNEITAPHLTSGDPKHESHYIIPHGYIYPLYNEITSLAEAGLRPASNNAATPLEAATRPATPVEEKDAAPIREPTDRSARSNLANQMAGENVAVWSVENVLAAPVSEIFVGAETEGKPENEISDSQSENQTVPARRSPEMPRLKNCTRIHAQIWGRETNPNNKQRYKFRNVKLYFWTTPEIEHLASGDHMEAEVIFNLGSTSLMSAALGRNARKNYASISANRAEALQRDVAALKRENATRASDQEEATIAYLVLKGGKSGVRGTKIDASQICILQWEKQTDKTFVPVLTLCDGEDIIQIRCDVNVREKNKFNHKAPQHIGYYDPLDYNNFRKKKTK